MKPKSQNADLANLPPALAPLTMQAHWVLWRWQRRRDRWTKPPYRPCAPEVNARSDDPTTWANYDAALDALRRANGSIDGIGFMLRGTELATIDLDHCLDPETGTVDAWAKMWLDAINGAYVERTPSGEGLRIIGINPGDRLQRRWTISDGRKGAAIEIYRNCERYITITGAQIGDCTELLRIDIETIEAHYDAAKSGTKNRTGFDFNNAGASIDYEDLIRNGAPKGARSELFHGCIWHLASKGMSVDEIVAQLAQYRNGIGEKYADRLHAEVRRSFEKWRAERQLTPSDTEPEEETIWDEVDRLGRPSPTLTNARRALRALGIQCRYNVFHDRLLVTSKLLEPSNNLDHIALMLRAKIHKAFHFDPGTTNTYDAMVQLCLENKFDPVLEYLNTVKWDSTPRLDQWLTTYLGATDTELTREFGRLALLAAVRRARQPGCKFDFIIVLEGPQGTQKSRAIETLAGIENFSDQTILGVRDREQQELLAGVWLYEIAELNNMRKTEVEHLRAFASRTHDRARPAYGRTRVDQPRRCVLFATTNEDRYLKMTDRRFWPIKTGTIDIEALRRDRDQLWAEAAAREPGATITLRRELWNTAHVEQKAREEADPWDDILDKTIGTIEQRQERVFSADLLSIVLGIHPGRQRDADFKRLGRCMRRLGWEGPQAIRIDNRREKGYWRKV